MIEQQATVIAVADGSALVEVQRQTGCSACGVGDRCGTSVLAKLFGSGASARLRVADRIGLVPGEAVLIGIRSDTLARASLAAYLLPLIAMIGAAFFADQAGLGDAGAAGLGLAGLLLGLGVTGFLTGGTGAKARFRPVLLRRLSAARPIVTLDPVHPAVGG
ncbi:MAG: SoxR reducing system RseC family protein [Thiohalocapsa sp.]|jgi:sigma-E factor negative regulatory protein RseC|nr:SoxR reducing system RseC family protein [Thiohalocapsa sp.]MCF7989200.1 SoxR reducing system RseC family protein [Thiohalocapsa sp.]